MNMMLLVKITINIISSRLKPTLRFIVTLMQASSHRQGQEARGRLARKQTGPTTQSKKLLSNKKIEIKTGTENQIQRKVQTRHTIKQETP